MRVWTSTLENGLKKKDHCIIVFSSQLGGCSVWNLRWRPGFLFCKSSHGTRTTFLLTRLSIKEDNKHFIDLVLYWIILYIFVVNKGYQKLNYKSITNENIYEITVEEGIKKCLSSLLKRLEEITIASLWLEFNQRDLCSSPPLTWDMDEAIYDIGLSLRLLFLNSHWIWRAIKTCSMSFNLVVCTVTRILPLDNRYFFFRYL